MKTQFGCLLLGLSLMYPAPAFAQASLNPGDEATIIAAEREDFANMGRKYAAGALTTEQDLMTYVQFLSYYDEHETAFEVLTKAMDQKQVTRSADNVAKAAFTLRVQDKYIAAIPYLKEAVALGHPTAQIQLTESYIEQSRTTEDKNCPLIETEVTKAVAAGMPEGDGMMYVGHCYSESAKQNMGSECLTPTRGGDHLTEAAAADVKISKSFFKQVSRKSSRRRDAQNWLMLYRDRSLLRKYMCGEIGGKK